MPELDHHADARRWLTARFEEPSGLVGVCWPVLYAFVRLTTSRRIMGDDAAPLPTAWEAASAYLHQHNACLIEAGPGHESIAEELLRTPGLSSDDVPDVQVAALAIEHGLTLCSRDSGFARFDRLDWHDPLGTG